jgi:hypothetical protein
VRQKLNIVCNIVCRCKTMGNSTPYDH